MRVLVLRGGRSAEREISIESAGFVADALRGGGHEPVMVDIGAEGSWSVDGTALSIRASGRRWDLLAGRRRIAFDVAFPVLHGPFGEDGTVQGLCETAGWPCAGADVMASSVGMNKITFKRLVSGAGIPTPPWLEAGTGEGSPAHSRIIDILGLPVFVKPCRLGSSVGISKVEAPGQLGAAIDLAVSYDPLVIVEKAVRDPREIEVSVMGDADGISSSVPGEVRPGKEWYDYEAKYDCPASRLVIPADLPSGIASAAREFSERAFGLIGGRGFARVDFLLSGSTDLYINEINTIPGFTSISMFPKLWEASGVPAPALLDRILSEAVSRRQPGLWR